jgi:hypothetical protein
MLVVLKTTSDGAPRQVQLRTGQVLKVGKSGWADFSISGDSLLEDEHFEVLCAADGCHVRVLGPTAAVFINGQATPRGTVFDGDEIRAGKTKFQIIVQGGPARPIADQPATEPVMEAPTGSTIAAAVATGAALSLAGICAYLDFGADVKALANATQSADVLIDKLTAEEKFQDAIKLRAYLLEKRQAVWWGCYCCREELGGQLPSEQTEAVDAAALWVEDPSEAHRRAAETKAAELNYSGPGATLGLSAFWSSGSLAPDGSPDVEPDERLTAQGVTAALITAAYVGDPTKAPDRFRTFLERGKDVAEGRIKIPGES